MAEAKTDLLDKQIIDLTKERNEYYSKFFINGLHSTLSSVESEFLSDSIDKYLVSSTGDIEFEVLEKVVLIGKYQAKSEMDSPLIEAAEWAISQTENQYVSYKLSTYISEQKKLLPRV